MADNDKKGPSKTDLRNMERFRRHTEAVARLNRTNERIREREAELAREATLDTERARDLIAEIAELRQEQYRYIVAETKAAKELAKATETQAAHMGSFAKNFFRINQAQEVINKNFGKQLRFAGDIADELNQWVGVLQKGARVLEEITNPDSKPTSMFARVSKMFYGDVQRAAKQHLALQDQLRMSAETTTSAWITAGISATRAAGKVDWHGFDESTRKNVSGTVAAVLDRAEANVRLSEMVAKTSMALGANMEEAQKFAGDLAFGAALDINDPKALKAVSDFTREITYMKEAGIIPANMEAGEFVKMMQKFGTSGTKGMERLRKDLRHLSTLPAVLVKNLKIANNDLGRFVATNSQELVMATMELNKVIGGQSTNLKNLGTLYGVMAVKAKEYGASAENAMLISEGLAKGFLKSDMTRDELSQRAGEQLGSDILKDDKVAREIAVEMVTKEAEASGKAVTDEDIQKKMDLLTTLAKEGSGSAAILANMAATTSRGIDAKFSAFEQIYGGLDVGTTAYLLHQKGIAPNEAEAAAIMAQTLGAGGDTKAALEAIKEDFKKANKETVALADDSSGMRDTQENMLAALRTMLDPVSQITQIERWSAYSVSLLTAIAGSAALSGLGKWLSSRGAVRVRSKLPGMDGDRFGGRNGPGDGGRFGSRNGPGDGGRQSGRNGPGGGGGGGEAARAGRQGSKLERFDRMMKEGDKAADVGKELTKKQTLSQKLVELGNKKIEIPTPEGGVKDALGRGFARGKEAVMGGLKSVKDSMKGGWKNFFSAGSDMAESVKGMSKFTKGLGALGIAMEAGSIWSDDGLSGAEKSARTGDMAAETALSLINPIALGAVMSRSIASMGARAMGNDEAADWIDNNIRLSRVGEGIGNLLADWFQDDPNDKLATDKKVSPADKKVAPAQKGPAVSQKRGGGVETANVAPSQTATTSTVAPAAMTAAPGSISGIAVTQPMVTNPDGSTKAVVEITFPAFNEAVNRAVNERERNKPIGRG